MSACSPHDSGGALGHVAEWETLAVDYVAGTLSQEDREAVDLHLATCPTCAEALARQRTIATLFGEAPLAVPPAALESQVLAALAAGRAPTLAPDTAIPTGEHSLEAAPRHRVAGPAHAGWWGRLTSILDRPSARRLTPALAAALILVVSLVGLTQLSPGDLTGRDEIVSTTVAAAQADTMLALPSTDVASESEDQAPTRSEGGGTESSDPGEATVTSVPDEVTADSGLIEPSDGGPVSTTSLLTQTTAVGDTVGGEGVGVFVTPPPTQVVYVTITAGETTAGAEDLVHWSTGLAPLPSELWLGAPTYAAFMPAEAADAMAVDLAAQGVHVSVSNSPPEGMAAPAKGIAQAGLPTIDTAATDRGASEPPDGSSSGPADQGALLLVVLIAR